MINLSKSIKKIVLILISCAFILPSFAIELADEYKPVKAPVSKIRALKMASIQFGKVAPEKIQEHVKKFQEFLDDYLKHNNNVIYLNEVLGLIAAVLESRPEGFKHELIFEQELQENPQCSTACAIEPHDLNNFVLDLENLNQEDNEYKNLWASMYGKMIRATTHGLSINIPTTQVSDKLSSLVKEIVSKIKSNQIMQHNSLYESLIPGLHSKAEECDCIVSDRNSGLRIQMEKQIELDMAAQFPPNKINSFSYISFASGRLFQDLISSTKLLLTGYNKKFTLILIDAGYKRFIDTLKSGDFAKLLNPQIIEKDYYTNQEITNAIFHLGAWLAFVKASYKLNTDITIKAYTSIEDAIAELPKESNNMLITVDLDSPEQEPVFSNPYQTTEQGIQEVQDYFKLADALLMSGAGMYALVDLYRHARKQVKVTVIASKHYTIGSLKFYIYKESLELTTHKIVALNRYAIYKQADEIVISDLRSAGSKKSLPKGSSTTVLKEVLSKGLVDPELMSNVKAAIDQAIGLLK